MFGWPFEEMHIPFRQRKEKVKLPGGAKVSVRVFIAAEWDSGAENGPRAYEKADLYTLSLNAQYPFIAGIYRALDRWTTFDQGHHHVRWGMRCCISRYL